MQQYPGDAQGVYLRYFVLIERPPLADKGVWYDHRHVVCHMVAVGVTEMTEQEAAVLREACAAEENCPAVAQAMSLLCAFTDGYVAEFPRRRRREVRAAAREVAPMCARVYAVPTGRWPRNALRTFVLRAHFTH